MSMDSSFLSYDMERRRREEEEEDDDAIACVVALACLGHPAASESLRTYFAQSGLAIPSSYNQPSVSSAPFTPSLTPHRKQQSGTGPHRNLLPARETSRLSNQSPRNTALANRSRAKKQSAVSLEEAFTSYFDPERLDTAEKLREENRTLRQENHELRLGEQSRAQDKNFDQQLEIMTLKNKIHFLQMRHEIISASSASFPGRQFHQYPAPPAFFPPGPRRQYPAPSALPTVNQPRPGSDIAPRASASQENVPDPSSSK
ncbi:hypothetical protein PCANC_04798 [Puccinia coronata f. sp. avenae]|uniref:Uncharacterized protein n=1 Tax=Puccinia coronata f. sp. avenae TaxID=200324 RepID=A0A2N5VWM1_9BASI|nr:hypothetical protein PCASD_25867 [Puccinia coronata f. sp. avenae]PLW54397.1 hypothetical protein PCANC_04798 [Puccinia coronata f. sp. avenae]